MIVVSQVQESQVSVAKDQNELDRGGSDEWPSFSLDDISTVSAHDGNTEEDGWGPPGELISWERPRFNLLERQQRTRFWIPNENVTCENRAKHQDQSESDQWIKPGRLAIRFASGERHSPSTAKQSCMPQPKMHQKRIKPQSSTLQQHPQKSFKKLRWKTLETHILDSISAHVDFPALMPMRNALPNCNSALASESGPLKDGDLEARQERVMELVSPLDDDDLPVLPYALLSPSRNLINASQL